MLSIEVGIDHDWDDCGSPEAPILIMRDPDTGNSRGFGFISYDSFEASDAAIEAMNGQYLCNRQITVSYAYKKDTKGERHGTPAERVLAASNPTTQKSRPHTLFASGPPTLPHANGSVPPLGSVAPQPLANGAVQPSPVPQFCPPPPLGVPPPPMQMGGSWPGQQQQPGQVLPPPSMPPPPQFRPAPPPNMMPPPPPQAAQGFARQPPPMSMGGPPVWRPAAPPQQMGGRPLMQQHFTMPPPPPS